MIIKYRQNINNNIELYVNGNRRKGRLKRRKERDVELGRNI